MPPRHRVQLTQPSQMHTNEKGYDGYVQTHTNGTNLVRMDESLTLQTSWDHTWEILWVGECNSTQFRPYFRRNCCEFVLSQLSSLFALTK